MDVLELYPTEASVEESTAKRSIIKSYPYARTTVTVEPEVEALIRAVMKERGLSFKDVVNSAIRIGLTANRPRRSQFVQSTFSLEAEENFRWDKALAVAEVMEDEALGRKLSLQK